MNDRLNGRAVKYSVFAQFRRANIIMFPLHGANHWSLCIVLNVAAMTERQTFPFTWWPGDPSSSTSWHSEFKAANEQFWKRLRDASAICKDIERKYGQTLFPELITLPNYIPLILV